MFEKKLTVNFDKMVIAGEIIKIEKIPFSKIIVDIVHPNLQIWQYDDLVDRIVLRKNHPYFSFKNVPAGRITLLRVYSKKIKISKFCFGSLWRNYFNHLLNVLTNFKDLKFGEIKYFLSISKFFIENKVYYVLPLLHYNDNIKVEISNEREWYDDYTLYFPYFGLHSGNHFFQCYFNCLNEKEYYKYVNNILEECSKSILIKSNNENRSLYELYEKKFHSEIHWVGKKWDKDYYLKPLKENESIE